MIERLVEPPARKGLALKTIPSDRQGRGIHCYELWIMRALKGAATAAS